MPSTLTVWTADVGDLSLNGVVNGLDPFMSFTKEELCWEISRWLRQDEVKGGGMGLPANLGRFDLTRLFYLWGVYSFRNVRSTHQTWTGE